MFQVVFLPIIRSSGIAHTASGMCQACLLAATTSVVELELNHTSGSSKQAWHIPDAVCTIPELLMMGRKTA